MSTKFCCPTRAPGQRASAVKVELQCGCDLLTLIDTLLVPREFVAAVLVRTDVGPNSAVRWHDYGGAPQCEQLFFFDTRRSVRELQQTVANVMYANHTLAMNGMPSFRRSAPRIEATRRCQCGQPDCPADAHRYEYWRQRGALRGMPVPNKCALTSPTYDRLSVAAYGAKMPELRNWHLYDRTSLHPLLGSTEPIEYLGGQLWRTLQMDQSVDEQAEHLTAPDGLIVPSRLTLTECDVDEVLRRRALSAHCTPLCVVDVPAFVDTLMTFGASRRLDTATRAQMDDMSPPEVVAVDDAQLRQALTDLAAAAGDRWHGFGCTCLIEAYLRRHCARQLDLVLVATPLNQLYRDVGDSVYHIESPLMRKLGVAGCLERAALAPPVLGGGGELRGIKIDRDAVRGAPLHFDTVLASTPDLWRPMRVLFGAFEYADDGQFRPAKHNTRQTQYAFVDWLRARAGSTLSMRRYGDVVAREQLPYTDYAAILRESMAAFDAPPGCSTLVELALHRGRFADAAVWRKHVDWMPTSIAYMLRHVLAVDVELTLHNTLTPTDGATPQQIFAPVCEALIVDELLATSNRRLAIARITSSLAAHHASMLDYRAAIMHAVCIVVIATQLDDLGAYVRTRPPPPPLPPPIEVPKTPKKKKTSAPRPQPPAKKKTPPPHSPPSVRAVRATTPPLPTRSPPRALTPPIDTTDWSVVGAKGKTIAPRRPTLAECTLADTQIEFFNLDLFVHGAATPTRGCLCWSQMPAFRWRE